MKTTIETMPAHLVESHRAARNWGQYPHNGAVRTVVDGDGLDDLESNGYDHVVSRTGAFVVISNIAGGNERRFRMVGVDGASLSDRALRHCDGIGFGGPRFSGPAARIAERAWDAASESEIAAE